MTKARFTSGQTAPRERWSAIAGLACAFVLATLAASSLASPPGGARTHAGATSVAVRRPSRSQGQGQGQGQDDARAARSTRWKPPAWAGVHDPTVGALDPAPRSPVDTLRLGGKPLPVPKRVETPRASLAARLDAAVAILSRRIQACALPPRRTPLADRPLTANCPAQGPPRAA